ncbi:hypothetical protein D1872_283810 [compost metagenome]
MINKATKFGNPKIHRTIVESTAFTSAIINWTSITFPKEETNFLPKYSSSTNSAENLLALNFAVKWVTFSFSNRKNKLRIIATNRFKLHFPISDRALTAKVKPSSI